MMDTAKRAALYRKAAARSLKYGDGTGLLNGDEYGGFFDNFLDGSTDDSEEFFCMSLCFMAAMVEAGDA